MKYAFTRYYIVILATFSLIISCQSEKDVIQNGFWVENDAENSLVKFTEDGTFLNIRYPDNKIKYEVEGSEIIFSSEDDVYRLTIKSASEMEIVLSKENEEFSFFRATPADYFFGIWQGTDESSNIEFTFAEKNNGYLSITEDTTKHNEFFTYQILQNELIIYKQDKTIDTVVFDFSDDLMKLSLFNKKNSEIRLTRTFLESL